MKKNAESEIKKSIQELNNQLDEILKMIEEIQRKVSEYFLFELIEAQGTVESINLIQYKSRIEELEKQIPKQLKKQYKHLSVDEIMATYDVKITDLRNKLQQIEMQKNVLENQINLIQQNKRLEEANAIIDKKLETNDIRIAEIMQFWCFLNDINNQELGVIRVIKTNDSQKEYEKEIVASRLEYELSKHFNNPKNGSLEYSTINQYGDHIRIESEFVNEMEEISLESRNALNMRKEKMERLRKKFYKHPNRYDKPGFIILESEKLPFDVRKIEVEITQIDLILCGIDPEIMKWQEKEPAKVDSTSIAKTTSKNPIKKSVISQIKSMFSRGKTKEDNSR